MSIEVIALIVLLIVFIISSALPISIGVLGFVAAYVVGSLISGLSLDEIYSVFPADLFILIVGVTYLFTIIQKSGAIDWIADWGLKLVRGHLGLIPWLIFGLSFVLASFGTYGLAVVSLMAPIALRMAYQYKISAVLMSIMIIMGMNAGTYSPVSVFGAIVNGVMQSSNLLFSPMLFLLNLFLFFTVVSAIAFFALGGLRLFKLSRSAQNFVAAAAEVSPAATNDFNEKSKNGLTLYGGVALAAIAVLCILAIGFDMNIGIACFIIGLVVALLFPSKQDGIIKEMPWGVIFLVSGILTYVGVMEKVGVIDYVTGLIEDLGNPTIATLMISYVGGVGSAFASTAGFLATMFPIAEPLLQNPVLSTVDVASAIAASNSIVDLSPFSTVGAILLANVQGMKDRIFFKQLLLTAVVLVACGPGLAWFLFVIIGTPW
ncbi:SLC13 family permease [Neobacillus vireti]|uniref:SLC13 family permease n=1 Tax=Neobacillus vireti TaxID=220686 RepID=UPI003000694A